MTKVAPGEKKVMAQALNSKAVVLHEREKAKRTTQAVADLKVHLPKGASAFSEIPLE